MSESTRRITKADLQDVVAVLKLREHAYKSYTELEQIAYVHLQQKLSAIDKMEQDNKRE